MTLILLIVILLLLGALLYAHRKHQDALSVLCDAFNHLAEKAARIEVFHKIYASDEFTVDAAHDAFAVDKSDTAGRQ